MQILNSDINSDIHPARDPFRDRAGAKQSSRTDRVHDRKHRISESGTASRHCLGLQVPREVARITVQFMYLVVGADVLP